MPVSWMPKLKPIEEQILEEQKKQWELKNPPIVERQTPPVTQWQPAQWQPTEIPESIIQPVQRPITGEPIPTRRLSTPTITPTKPVTPGVAPTTPEKAEPWELPKVWAEQAMGAVGEGISKVPILPEVLEFISPVFEFIQEKLEKPFAAIITTPFSPTLPWKSGESWIEHEKREYDTWKAPTYVKGFAEFLMPLWWLPWIGWAGKGARALGIGNKMARALVNLPAMGKLSLPTKEILNTTLYKPDFFKRVALWSEDKPVLAGVVRSIGGPSAFVKAPAIGESAEQIVKREIINRAVIRDMRGSAQGLLMPKLRAYGDPVKLLDVADDGLVRSATAKVEGSSRYLWDVVENKDAYTFATKEAKGYVDEIHTVLNEVRELAAKEGVELPKDIKVHRIVKGITTLDKEGLEHYEKSEFGSLFESRRHYKTQLEAVEAGKKTGKIIDYGLNPNESIASTINHYIRKIADKRFDDELKKLGVSPLQKITELDPPLVKALVEQSGKLSSADFALKTITRLRSYKGTSIAGATLGKIRSGLPDIAERIDDLLAITPQQTDQIVSAMGKEFWQTTKINPREFKVILSQFNKTPGKIRLGEISDTIRQLNITNVTATKAIVKIYKQAYQLNKTAFDGGISVIQNELKNMIGNLKGELLPLKTKYRKLAEKYTTGQQILGEGEEIMRRRPALRGPVYPREAFPRARPMAGGLIFPKEVVDLVEKATGDAGSQWLKGMSAVSGTSRMLTASLDFSAPFIQGLGVLGRNPVVWLKAVTKQYQFFTNPENLYKYMADPLNMVVRAERISMGGSSQSWEFFEAMAPLQRAIGKIPKVGEVGQKVIGQTYGRAEAAFTGFGEVSRNEMWKALRRKNMAEPELRELARTIDRMTGVMSMEALGIGMTQRDLESAFVFFAPRYTRASLSFVSDVFKGGMTGAEARKAMGGLMGGGLAMYYGVSTALGQTPNLDPRSGRFMTIKVGDSHIGIGGILYGLMRLSSNVATTVAEEPLDLVRLSRYDNPFIRFMFERTSPLTGGIANVVEQKDYFGQPFENIADWGKFLAEKVTPIAVQQVWEEGKKTPMVFAAGVAGGRTFPKSAWELREEARDKYAMEALGKPYKSIPIVIQRQIDEKPDIKALTEEADKRTIQIGEGLSVGFLNRQRDRDDARFMYEQRLWQLQKAIDDGAITPYEFREEMSNAGYGLGRTYEFIDSQEIYKEVLEKLQEPRDISSKFIGDVAYSELMTGLYSGQLEDQYGFPLWDKRAEFEDSIRQKYGEGVWQYIQTREADRRKTLPPLAQEYYKAQEVLRPYWDVEDWAVKAYGQVWADSSRGQSFISRIRKQMRLMNPEVARYYDLFYKSQ